MRRHLVHGFLIVLAFSARAQDEHVVDSLRLTLRASVHDSVRFKALLGLAGEYLDVDPDTASDLCLRALELASRTGRPGDVGEAEGWLGYVEEQRGHIAQAITHYEKSLAECERLNDKKGLSAVLNNLGAIYTDQGRLDEALYSHRRSLAIRYEVGDSSGVATSLNNIGFLLFRQGRIMEALERYTEALRLYERFKDHEGIATALHNIAGINREQGEYRQALENLERALLIARLQDDAYGMATTEDNIGDVLNEQGRADDALLHYQRALALHDSVNDMRGMGRSWRNMAGIWLQHGDATRAVDAAERSLAMYESSEDERGRTEALLMSGRALEKLGRSREAEERFIKALELARALSDPRTIRDVSGPLSEHFRAKGDWKAALEMRDLHALMRDSVRNEEIRRSTIRQQYQYEFERKEADLETAQAEEQLLARERLQKEKNRRNVLLFIGAGVLLLALGLWSRLRYTRRSRAAIAKEKDVSDGLLHNILPVEVATELKVKGHAEARYFDRATILFTDFKGFTELSEQVTPTELVEELNACFKVFDGLMEKYRIEKIKTIGDAYMAAGGLPDPKFGAPVDVVKAALEMQDFMAAHKVQRKAAGKPYFEMRLGIHTGPVVAGIVGVKKFQYDIWGDAVNTASRMESSGEVGKVNISESTYELVKHEAGLTFTPRGRVHAKGKGELEMYFVHRSA